jgi:polyphenol oxidase
VLSSFPLYQAALLSAYSDRLIHGFTGRPFSIGGKTPNRAEHRAMLWQQLGVDARAAVMPDQTHGDGIRAHTEAAFENTDAIILTEPNRPVLLQFADCVPILLYDPVTHTGAVIHAGWRGTALTIAFKTVARLMADQQVAPHNLRAVIGPSIGGCCFETSPDAATQLLKTVTGCAKTGYDQTACQAGTGPQGNPMLDLKRINTLQLQVAGLQADYIECLPFCTLCDTQQRFWSYRRGDVTERQGAFLCLK